MIVVKDIMKRQEVRSAVALGFFDGVHLAHRAVIARAVERRQEGLVPCVFTFDPAGSVPAGKRGITLLQTEEQKDRILEQMGVELVFRPGFDTFKMLEPRKFVEEILISNLGARVLICGYNYHFGKGAAAGVEDLRTICGPFGVRVEAIDTVRLEGGVVSSTRVREAIRRGEMALAGRLLGSPFTLDTAVEDLLGPGEGMPRGVLQRFPMGFTLPPPGRYRSSIRLGSGELPAVSRVGEEGAHGCRTYFWGDDGAIAGERVAVALLAPLETEG